MTGASDFVSGTNSGAADAQYRITSVDPSSTRNIAKRIQPQAGDKPQQILQPSLFRTHHSLLIIMRVQEL